MSNKNYVPTIASSAQSQMKFGLLNLQLVFLLVVAVSMLSVCRAESDIPEDTRRWSNGVGLWGKRSPSPALGSPDFEGIMHRGARLVQKRPEDSWHKLNSLWGKRSAGAASNWQTATGLWGKRSAPPLPPSLAETGAADYLWGIN